MHTASLFRKLYNWGSLHSLYVKAPYILAAVLTALVSVGFGMAIDRITDFSAELLGRMPSVFLLLTPVTFLLARWTVQYLDANAAGSGIPQVMASLDLSLESGSQVHRLLNFKILLGKILSCSLCLLGGGLVGREGPMVQVAAIIFRSIGSLCRRLSMKVDEHSLIVAGGAAGVAAAFNTPLGGIVFAMEELLEQHFSKVRSALIVAVIIAGMVAQSLVGPYLYLGAVSLQVPKVSFLPPLFVLSALTGLAL